jgi:TolA-binding protein
MRLVLVLSLLAAAGCVTVDPEPGRALAEADARIAQGDYPAALAAYEAYLARYPNGDGAGRARAARTMMQELVSVRRERDRLAAREADLMREVALARETAARDGDLARQQLAAREAEVAKLRQEVTQRQAEAARLREDLEALKRTDLQMERRRR